MAYKLLTYQKQHLFSLECSVVANLQGILGSVQILVSRSIFSAMQWCQEAFLSI